MYFNIVAMLCILACMHDFKKGYSIFLIFQMFWYQSTIFMIGSFNLTTYVFCPTIIFFIYLHKRINFKESNIHCPYNLAFIGVVISFFVTSVFAYAGFVTELSRSISIILRTYLLIWISWNVFDDKNDFKYLYKLLTYLFLFATVYGLIEYATHLNVLLDYKISMSGDSLHKYDENNLRGYRLTSIFEHPIGAGMNFGLFSMFTFTSWIKYNEKLPNYKLAIIVALLCIPCILLTKMRSAIVFTVLLSLSFIDFKFFKRKKSYILIAIVIFALPFMWNVVQDNLYIITSIFTSKVRNTQVGGSSTEMRLEQLDAAINLMKMSPIGGLGETFKGLLINQYTILSREFESIWLEQIAMHGIFGICTTIILIIWTTIVVPLKYKSYSAFVFAGAYWLTYTMSSVPSFRIVLLYLAEFYFIKNTDLYRLENSIVKRKRVIL